MWKEAITSVVYLTNKPVAVGILGRDLQQTISLLETAKKLGRVLAVIPATGKNEEEIIKFFTELDSKTSLPIIIYNTEKFSVHSVESLIRLDSLKKINAIKESSCHRS